MSISHSELLSLLHYDPETGYWSRRTQVINGKPPGEIFEPTHNAGYVHIFIGGKKRLAHRLAVFYMTGLWPIGRIDHRDTVRSNNKWENIRPATQSQNLANQRKRKDNTSGYKGISWSRTKWRVRLSVNNKQLELGYCRDLAEACRIYIEAAQQHYGEFARAR